MENKTKETNEMKKTAKVKEKISLYKYHKSKFLAWILVFVTEIYMAVTEYAKVDGKIWAGIILILLLIASALFITVWLANCLSKELDKEDELSKANMTKAHESIASFMLFVFAVVVLFTIFWRDSITVTIDHEFVMNSWLIVYSFYNALESGFFLHYEGRESDCEEDE